MTLTEPSANVQSRQRWTPPRESLLIELWEAKESIAAISERLGATEASVVCKAAAMGLERRNSPEWPDEAIEQLKRLWAENFSASEIGRALGKTRCSVLGKVHRLELANRNPALSAAQKAGRKLAKEGERETARRVYKATWAREQRAEERGDAPPRSRRRPAPIPVWGGSLSIGLLDLKPGQCRFSYSATSPFLFCGQPAIEGKSWCAHCAKIVHAAPTGSGKQFKMNGWKAA